MSRSQSSRKRVFGFTLLLTCVLILAVAGAALAAQWNNVSGTCNADNSWYTSSNERHITTPNDTIKAYWDGLCTGGLSMCCVTADTHTAFTGTTYWSTVGVTKTIATGVLNGTVFHNKYHENGSGSDHTFNGHQWY